MVLVDDLDRCERKYVIELMEGIQTLFRSKRMTYVVAADRKWICSTFEKEYEDFSKTIGKPGRPLGYLFTDKIFQVSIAVPRLSSRVRESYWNGLLRPTVARNPGELDKELIKAEDEAREEIKDIYTQKELFKKIKEAKDTRDPVKEQAMRAAAAKQITGIEAQRQAEHWLKRFADMLEPNPRAMKRFVNDYILHVATHFLEDREVQREQLARWKIIELRWPLLADLLASSPGLVADLAKGQLPANSDVDDDLKALFGNDEVMRVVWEDRVKNIIGLKKEDIRAIVGLVY